MDIFCTVEGQRLTINTPMRHFPRSSEEFVRFLFTFTEDWDGLLTFAQFRQGGNYTNRYLDTVTVTEDGVTSTYPAVTLPGWPKAGPLTMTLMAHGNGTVIGTTNFVMLHVDPTGYIDDAEVSDMDETLYQQLVNRVIANDLALLAVGGICPEQFGARGDGVTDDSEAFQQAFGLGAERDEIRLIGDKNYLITQPVRIEKPVRVVGSPNAVIHFTGDGCFLISNPTYDNTRTYQTGDLCWKPFSGSDTYVLYRMGEDELWHRTDIPAGDFKRGDYDDHGSDWSGTTSIFDGVVFGYCDKCFTGDLKYLYFTNCKIHHCGTVFYCEGESANKKASWFGKIDLNDCEIRYNKELFYLSDVNFNGGTLSLNAVNITGGVINETVFFLQTPNHNYNHEFRVENLFVHGCDVEKSDVFLALSEDIPAGTAYVRNDWLAFRAKWIGGLFLFNVVFHSCHIELFTFLHHSYLPYKAADASTQTRGLMRSNVTFENSFIQHSSYRLIEIDDVYDGGDKGMYQSTYAQTCFLVSIINCPMAITAQRTKAAGSSDEAPEIGANRYYIDQRSFPLVRMTHRNYACVFESYPKTILLNIFAGQLATYVRLPLSVQQQSALAASDITNANATTIAILCVSDLPCTAQIEAEIGSVSDKTAAEVETVLLAAGQTKRQAVLKILNDNVYRDGLIIQSMSSVTVRQPDLRKLAEGDITASNIDKVTSLLQQDLVVKNEINALLDGRLAGQTYRSKRKILLAADQGTRRAVLAKLLESVTSVANVGEYIDANNASDYIEAGSVTVNMHRNSDLPMTANYEGFAAHDIGYTRRVLTTYMAAKTNTNFLSQLPNGSLVSFGAPKWPSDVYMVLNDQYGVKVLNVANQKNNMEVLVMSDAYSNEELTNRTEWQNSTALKRVEIQFTPAAQLPGDLFDGCTALADIFVPWPSPSNDDLTKTDPWTNKRPVTVHYSDKNITYTEE